MPVGFLLYNGESSSLRHGFESRSLLWLTSFHLSAGDFAGRMLPSLVPVIQSQAILLFLSLLRIAFIPFFLYTSNATSAISDGAFLLLLGLLGLSNGFVACVPSSRRGSFASSSCASDALRPFASSARTL